MADTGKFDRAIFGDLEQFDTTIAFNRTITEPSVTVSDVLVRKIDLFRVITEPSIVINDAVNRTMTLFRIILEPAIAISDSVNRNLALFRIILEPTVSIVDSVARILIKSANIRFITRIKQSLSFTTRIKDVEDHSI